MFSKEARKLITDLLEIFADIYCVPIAMYELKSDGSVEQIARADKSAFPPHCHSVWSLTAGEGACAQDMKVRALSCFNSGVHSAQLCHAGMTTELHPIKRDGVTVGVLQYGAYVTVEEQNHQPRLQRHQVAMNKLAVSGVERNLIEGLLLSPERKIPEAQCQWLNQTMPRLLELVLNTYISHQEVLSRTRRGAIHDVQVHLQAALALSENLIEDLAAAPSNTNEMEEEAKHLLAMIEQAATITYNLTLGTYLPKDYRFRSVPIGRFVHHAVELCSHVAKEKQIEFVVNLRAGEFYPDAGQVRIDASEEHLQQAFNNLMHNAVKYSYRTMQRSQGGEAVHRFVTVDGKIAGNGYQLVIRNYGVGIAPDELQKIFDEGYQSRLTKREHRTGSGLGLFNTRKIIRAHGGVIEVHSRPVNSSHDEFVPYLTDFTIWLPFKNKKEGLL